MNRDYCIFIMTYGRPSNVITLKTLSKIVSDMSNVFLVCSTDDKKLNEYKKLYGEKVQVFSKEDYKKDFDLADNFGSEKDGVIIFARNACYDIAEKLGYRYFIALDDDYTHFLYKFDSAGYRETLIKKSFDKVVELVLNYYKSLPSCKTISLSQNGDFIGGADSGLSKGRKIKRKAMNSFFCDTRNRLKFLGRINEDVNSYVKYGRQGELIFQINSLSLYQKQTQSNAGGMTDIYNESGTYIKSFYSVMINPSCVSVSLMGSKDMRLHHKVNWELTAPKILNESYKK